MKLSIIIPFYNTYELTCKLLEVFRPQMTEEVEIIIIDDSNDKRLDQFKDIAKIMHFKKRQGLSKARNIGIDNTTGKYIALVDSDDMVANDYVKSLIDAINTYDSDIMVFDWQNLNNGDIRRRPDNYAVWKAIYKRETMPRFNEDMWYNEDVPFQEEINNRNLNKIYLDKLLYFYNAGRIGSNMWERDQKRREKMIKVEVIENFTLQKFDELLNVERKGRDTYGWLYVGDTFYCEKEMADYLLGNNKLQKPFVKVLEVTPKEEPTEPVKTTTKKTKKSKK